MLKYDKETMVIVPRETTENMWTALNDCVISGMGIEYSYNRTLSEAPEVEPVIALSDVQVLVKALKNARKDMQDSVIKRIPVSTLSILAIEEAMKTFEDKTE